LGAENFLVIGGSIKLTNFRDNQPVVKRSGGVDALRSCAFHDSSQAREIAAINPVQVAEALRDRPPARLGGPVELGPGEPAGQVFGESEVGSKLREKSVDFSV